jgi:hypothetical protein
MLGQHASLELHSSKVTMPLLLANETDGEALLPKRGVDNRPSD